jgi:hypothetical protein
MSRIMDMNEADILAGRAKTVSAKYYDSESHEEIPYKCPDDEKVAGLGGCNSITNR